jgi:hypothetical protein
MEEPDIDDTADVESQDEDEPLIKSAFGGLKDDDMDDRKSWSFVPRSYSGRRRLLYIGGFVFLTIIVAWTQSSTGKGKEIIVQACSFARRINLSGET